MRKFYHENIRSDETETIVILVLIKLFGKLLLL